MDPRETAERIRIEHEILGHVQSALALALDAPFTAESSAHWLERAAFFVESFHRHLVRLFVIEEEGDYMGFVAGCQQPTLGNRVDRLRIEHRVMVEDLLAIANDARTSRADNLNNLHELRQRMLGVFGQFDDHLARERQLCAEAFLVDIGGEGG